MSLTSTAAEFIIPQIPKLYTALSASRRGRPDSANTVCPPDFWRMLYRRQRAIPRFFFALITHTRYLEDLDQQILENPTAVLNVLFGFFNPPENSRKPPNGVSDTAPAKGSRRIRQRVSRNGKPAGNRPQADMIIGRGFRWAIQEADRFRKDEPAAVLILTWASQFCYRIWLPCWLHYRQTPGQLLRKARQGDYQALEDLLRLDKSMVADPKVNEHWQQILTSGGPTLRDRMLQAMSKAPGRAVSIGRLKACIAAGLWIMADMLGETMSIIELRDLFDRAAKGRTGAAIDTDLPDSEEAFYQAVYRERKDLLRAVGVSLSDWQEIRQDLATP